MVTPQGGGAKETQQMESIIMRRCVKESITALVSALLLVGTAAVSGPNLHTKTPFQIQEAEWQEHQEELTVAGHGQYRCTVHVFNAGNSDYLGSTVIPDKRWKLTIEGDELGLIPCRVAAEQVESEYCRYAYDEMDVQRAPEDCGPNLEQYFFWY